MTPILRRFLPVFILALSVAVAADNSKGIATALQDYAEAKAKADDIHKKAMERAKNDAIPKLAKLAARAYTEKDRNAETNAWKAILKIDPTSPKATQYFRDLGTLQEVLREIQSNDQSAPERVLARFAGKWKVTYSNGATEGIEFDEAGVFQSSLFSGKAGSVELRLSESAIHVTYPAGDHMNRFTLAGEKILVEQWGPPTGYPKQPPTFFGRAVKAN